MPIETTASATDSSARDLVASSGTAIALRSGRVLSAQTPLGPAPVKPPARVVASLPRVDCATRWQIVGDLGVVRRRKDTRGWYIDLRPYGRIYRNRGIPIDSKKTALRILEQIRGELAAGQSIHRVLAAYLPERSKPNRFRSHLERWLEVKRRETKGGSLGVSVPCAGSYR